MLASFAAFNKFIFIANAGPNIPISHPTNGWHWGVDVGDELYYEVEFILTNTTTGEVNDMFKDIWIYNITSIELNTIIMLHTISLILFIHPLNLRYLVLMILIQLNINTERG